MSVKTRDQSQKIDFPPTYWEGVPFPKGGSSQTWKGRQYTASEGHPRNPRTGKYEEGGNFFSYRVAPDIKPAFINWENKAQQRKYSGPVTVSLVPTNYGDFSKAPSGDSSYLDPIGATAINIVDPTNPNAETGVALGEIIKDRSIPIPGIQAWKRRTEVAKAAGSEYLNAVFGWLPLVSDMKDTAQSVMDGNMILENYHNASGSFVHREFAFPDIESTEESVVGKATANYGNVSVAAMNNGVQDVTRSRKKRTRRWFSGAFTYQANSASNSFARCLGIGSDAEKLFGTALTPDLIWELTPWSWAIDWFSNAQNVISNVRAFELAGLVMRYGYIMEETSIVDTYTMPPNTITNSIVHLPPCTMTYTVKRRREANPFGFGVGWEGLSPTQLAITAALGITRLR